MKSVAFAALRHARWLLSRMGRGRTQRLVNVLAVTFVSVGIPGFIGMRFLSAFILIPLACLSVFLVADLIVDSLSNSPAGEGDFAGKVIACVLVGWLLGLTILFIGLAALNALNWSAGLLLPGPEIFADALWLSLASCVFVAGATWQVIGRLSSGMTRLTMKFAIVVASVLCIHGCNRWQTEGIFVLTTRVITWISGFAGVAMFAAGAALLALPSGSKRSASR